MGLLGAGVYYGMTVKLGERTFFQHIQAIWETKETQELRRGPSRRLAVWWTRPQIRWSRA